MQSNVGASLLAKAVYPTYKYRWHPTTLNCASIYPHANINNQ